MILRRMPCPTPAVTEAYTGIHARPHASKRLVKLPNRCESLVSLTSSGRTTLSNAGRCRYAHVSYDTLPTPLLGKEIIPQVASVERGRTAQMDDYMIHLRSCCSRNLDNHTE